ncbi:MAG: hypothetical protein HRU14_14655 [Planctomycetes bacterium]|nr:hypothetical protein [Planctomycetota bacterium]
MTEMGFLALPIIRANRSHTDSQEKRLRSRRIEEQLRPWANAGYEGMSIDLDLLTGLLTYPEKAVVKAVHTRLAQILPKAGAADWGDWIKKHRNRLQWDRKLRRYTEKESAR